MAQGPAGSSMSPYKMSEPIEADNIIDGDFSNPYILPVIGRSQSAPQSRKYNDPSTSSSSGGWGNNGSFGKGTRDNNQSRHSIFLVVVQTASLLQKCLLGLANIRKIFNMYM